MANWVLQKQKFTIYLFDIELRFLMVSHHKVVVLFKVIGNGTITNKARSIYIVC
jgi:hypothetical protein